MSSKSLAKNDGRAILPVQDLDAPLYIPDTVRNHVVAKARNSDKTKDPEIAPFNHAQSKTTGAVSVKNKILVGRIIKCRIQGMTYTEIGKNLGINPGVARRYVERGVAEAFPEEDAETMRGIANAQYDAIIKSYWSDAIEMGDEKAAKVLSSAIAEKRKLNATDKQVVKKTETTQSVQIDIVSQAAGILENFGPDFIDVESVDTTETKALPSPKSTELQMDEHLHALLEANRTFEDGQSEDEEE